MELVSQMVGDVVKRLMGFVTLHVGYLISSTKKVEHMKERMKRLEDKNIDVIKIVDENSGNNKDTPARVDGWLKDVKKINEDVKSISKTDHTGCFNIKGRHQATVKALKAIETIDDLITEDLPWRDVQIPLGKVDPKLTTIDDPSASTSSGGDTQTGSKSRDRTFSVALKHLQQADKTRVIALCGMGGVGKTTMMNQLKKVARDKTMFNWIVTADVGENPDMKAIQHVVAVQTGDRLPEKDEKLWAEYLRKRFENLSDRKEKILVILDDVWNNLIKLNDIGLSPLPNGVKLLLTSRDANICREIASDVNSVIEIVQVEVLEETEARALFFQITEVSEKQDHDLCKIGGKIVKKCGGLPLAIKLIAPTLKSKRKSVWKDMFHRMKKNNPGEKVQECIEISFTNIKEAEDKAIFQLCGMLPEDSYIPIEDLTRYAWGLKLLEDVSTVGKARDRTELCVQRLIDANLLMNCDSDHNDCVKMHDLVLAFVVDSVSKGEDAWIIDHGDMSKWNEVKKSKSCKQISLACKGGSEFPDDFKFPNLSFLKLLQGDESLKFPENFYGEMQNLQVISYDKMEYPLLPTSIQCSGKLRSLCLHNCSLTFDISCIGGLSKLEVLSFANSHIKKLPSTFKNLEKLRVLDLTGCDKFIVIDDGVLKSLVNLEELYMTTDLEKNGIDFTEKNCNELSEVSKKLSALDIEFFENKARPQNMSFENLKRFRMSVGCSLKKNMQSYYNTLMLVTSKHEILESRMNGLFGETEVLLLTVDGMNNLADMEIPQYSSFHNLTDLVVKNCGELRYLFTLNVATALSKLESLEISSCPIMEELIHIESHEAHTITFPKLKSLTLGDLPMLSCLCNSFNVIELPHLADLELSKLPNFTSIYPKNKLTTSSISTMPPLLNEKVVIPKLERLSIYDMENLEEIWPCENSSSEKGNVSMLREIDVGRCNRLVNLFPCNPVSLLPHLEVLRVMRCGSIEVLFNIDIDCVRDTMKCYSKLKRIGVFKLGQLREIWRVKGVNNSHIMISSFQDVETIIINWCESFRNVFTTTTSNFDLRALTELEINGCGGSTVKNELVESSHKQKIHTDISEEEIDDGNFNVAFPSTSIHSFHHLHHLKLWSCDGVEMVFKINSREPATTHQKSLQLFPYLEDLELHLMERMSHVWKCSNWNEFLILQKQHPQLSSFHNLTTICIERCGNIKYMLSPLMAKLLSNLKNVTIEECASIEEVVSNRDDNGEMHTSASTHTITTFFPHLHSLTLRWLPNLKHIGGGGGGGAKGESKFSEVGVVTWSLCQYARELHIDRCDALPFVIPSYALGHMQKLEKLTIRECKALKEVFESQGMIDNNIGDSSTNVDEGNGATLALPINICVPQLSHLREIQISKCNLLEYMFTFSTLKSLRQLEKLKIEECKAMEVIVKQEINGEQRKASSDQVVFPCLKSVELIHLPNLLGFFLGMNDFEWKSLEKVVIRECPQVKVFTSGYSTTPNLNLHSSLGKHHIPKRGLNFHQIPHGTPWSYQNLVEIDLKREDGFKKIIPSSELLQVKKLERIQVEICSKVEEIFEVTLEGTKTVVEIPNLREVKLYYLDNLKYLWNNNRGMELEFPNLARLKINRCNRLNHVFTSSMVGSLLQLEDLDISHNSNIEVIVKEEKEEECDGRVKHIDLPCLKSLRLFDLFSLKGFCKLEFPNLTRLEIRHCFSLKHVFTSSMVGSLLQLQDLEIGLSENIEVIVKEEEEEECDGRSVKQIEFPRLKSLRLYFLARLKGFCLGKKEAFSFPSLVLLEIRECQQFTVFTTGHTTTPELKRTIMTFGVSYLKDENLNSFINTKLQEGLEL